MDRNNNSGLYDPPPEAAQGSSGDGRTQKLNEEIDNAMKLMQSNLNKASERGERVDVLTQKTDNLSTQANSFRRGANRVRKQMWWKDMKMRMCIIVAIIILLIVIIVPSVIASHKH